MSVAEELTFHLEDFDGPLELLLALVAKHKMDLHNIPILELIDQYTATVARADPDPEAASAFIEMAARLVEMKSYLLLPRSEEGERMKQEFTGQLIEYDQCRRMAALLRQKAEAAPVFVRPPMEMEFDNTYDLHHAPQVLADYWAVLSGRTRLRRAYPAAVRAAGHSAHGVGDEPGGVHSAAPDQRYSGKNEPAVQPPADPQHQRGHLSGLAGAGARRPRKAGRRGPADHAAGPHPT